MHRFQGQASHPLRAAQSFAAALLALGTLAAIHQPAAAASGTHASNAVVPALDYKERTLANGLRIFSIRDTSSPDVAVQVWYGVGSKNDPQGRSGFAHLFEHLMFKATRDMPAEYIDHLVEDVGGEDNASTSEDFTNYYEVIPANHLQSILWAEAQRMSSLKVDQTSFDCERKVVEEELRETYLEDPYGRLELATQNASYAVHPYKRGTIGSLGDLDRATLADVKTFHDIFYRPDNATLIVIGNFDQTGLDGWIDDYFAPLSHPSSAIPRVTVVEPRRTRARTVSAYAPMAPQPAVEISWQIPAASDRDTLALQVLATILSTGRSSRLYDSLVYRQRIAQSVDADAEPSQQGGLFRLQVILAPGHSVTEGESALLAEISRARAHGVTTEELIRAQNQIAMATLSDSASLEGQGFRLGTALLVEGDADRANTDMAGFESVSVDDIQRIARRYLSPARRVTIRYLAESGRRKNAGSKDDLVRFSPKVVAADMLPHESRPSPVPDTLPHQPPGPAAPLERARPVIAERTLANGLRVVIARTGDWPIATAMLAVRSGSASDPKGMAGLQAFTNDLLVQGSMSRSARAFATAIEGLGGQLDTGSDPDSSGLTLTLPADLLASALPLIGDAVRHPAFAPDEITRLRATDTDDLSADLDEPNQIAQRAATKLVYGDTPYGRLETLASLGRIDRKAVIEQFKRVYRPDNAVLILTGDVDPVAGFALAEASFGAWVRPSRPLAASPSSTPMADGASVVAIDVPDADEASVMVVAPSLARDDPRYHQAELADAMLGGGYSSRLNQEVRVKRGFSYGAFSDLDARRGSGLASASAQTRNETAAETAKIMTSVVENLGAASPDASELAARKASLTGGRDQDEADSGEMAEIILDHVIYGVPLSDIGGYRALIDAIDGEQVRSAASVAIDPQRAVTIVVGDSRRFLPALRKRYPATRLLTVAELDRSPLMR